LESHFGTTGMLEPRGRGRAQPPRPLVSAPRTETVPDLGHSAAPPDTWAPSPSAPVTTLVGQCSLVVRRCSIVPPVVQDGLPSQPWSRGNRSSPSAIAATVPPRWAGTVPACGGVLRPWGNTHWYMVQQLRGLRSAPSVDGAASSAAATEPSAPWAPSPRRPCSSVRHRSDDRSRVQRHHPS